MTGPDENLRQYATDRQWEYLTATCGHGSARSAALALGVNPSAVQRSINALKAKAAKHGYAPEYDVVHPAPPGFRSQGHSTLYDRHGNVRLQWHKTTIDRDKQLELLREAIQGACDDLPRLRPRKRAAKGVRDDLMVVVPFGDPHFGMYSWAEETGADFNIDIAREDLCGAVDYLIAQSPPAGRCVIANLGDFFHADNLEGKTARSGNILDMDTRLPKVIRVGLAAMRQAIATALSRHETVEVVNAPGNHDDVLGMAMSIMLANIYENEPRVKVHDDPRRRFYVRHGKVLIGITHGDQTRDRDLPGIMATERAEDWGATKHRYFYRGHHHHDTKEEFNGCIVEQFRTLAPGDAYAVGHGWLSGRDMKLIVHDERYGEVSRVTCSIDLLRGLAA